MDTKAFIPLFEPFELFIFDLDGTLADTMPIHFQACQDVCQPLGFDFPYDFFIEQAGIPTKQVFINLMNLLGLPHDGIKLAIDKEKRFLELLPSVRPLPFVYEIAKHFQGQKKFAIGSGGEKKSVQSTLSAMNLPLKFEAIVSADDVVNHKPAPDTFQKCAELCEIEPEKSLVFEDGIQGMIAAKSAGMECFNVVNHTFFRQV